MLAAGPRATFRELRLWAALGEEKGENTQWHVCENITVKLAGDC